MTPMVNMREAETSRLSPATSSSPNQILAPPRVWATLHLRDQAGAGGAAVVPVKLLKDGGGKGGSCSGQDNE